MDRKSFLKSILGAGAIIGSTGSTTANSIAKMVESNSMPVSGSMIGHRANPIAKVKVAVIGLGNRGNTLVEMLQYMVEQGTAEIVALCDLRESKVNKVIDKIKPWQKTTPKKHFGSDDAWESIAKQDNVDLMVITTPWEWHAPMSIFGMENGKHVASEVPIACTLAECWQIIETSERTKQHCIMIENCCYNEEELFVLNMIEQGVFGDLTHAEGAYLHDLRALLLSEEYYENQWRIKHHTDRDGNLYTTHGIGPISNYLRIGRGDTFTHLTSMSSRELNLSKAAGANSPYAKIKCGDMNNTLIKTEKGKTVLLQFDVHTGRPYSRINKVVGTNAVHDGYPSRLYVEPTDSKAWGHKWLSDEEYNKYKKEYTHPIIKKLKTTSASFKQGHGGMDFIMMYRLITCLNKGLPLDINLYDGVMWTAITPLSELSVASKSMPIPFPDFTGGMWKEHDVLEVMRDI